MEEFLNTLADSYQGYFNYVLNSILVPSRNNFFYWLLGISLVVWILEILFPWRKGQSIFRKDFWLDLFYLFFNFFLFSLIGYHAISTVVVDLFNDFLGLFGITNLVAIHLEDYPSWAKLLIMFVIADFIQWNIHRLLHKVPFLWEFHKVHHSVEEMGFAAHFRFHWMETVIYRTLQYIPLAMLGFGLQSFFMIHLLALVIGHINHANLNISYGPLKYILNNPVMHLWHHAKDIPSGRNGVNFGLSLSIWDYLFGTAYIPERNGSIPLGFKNVEKFPRGFFKQFIYPFKK